MRKFGISILFLILLASTSACDQTDVTPTPIIRETATPTTPSIVTPTIEQPVEDTPTAVSQPSTPTLPMAIPVCPTPGLDSAIVSARDVITIGVSVPRAGGDAGEGQAIINGVQLAIEQVNARGGITLEDKPYILRIQPRNDYAPTVAERVDRVRSNADLFVREQGLLAVVGPYNSGVGHTMQPIFNRASLALISPSNTDPLLTREDPANPDPSWLESHRPEGRDYLTYFRISTTDIKQGSAVTYYLRDKLKKSNIYVLQEDNTYGETLAKEVKQQFTDLGGGVIEYFKVAKNLNLPSIGDQRPDALFYGGTIDNLPTEIGTWMNRNGLKIPLVGGDGIKGTKFIKDYVTGDANGLDEANGIYATLPTNDVEHVDTGKQFVEDYRQRFCDADMGAYSASAYDATNIIISAIRTAGIPDRKAVRKAIADTKNFEGVLGTIGFDTDGDNTDKSISIYKVNSGEWEFLEQVKR